MRSTAPSAGRRARWLGSTSIAAAALVLTVTPAACGNSDDRIAATTSSAEPSSGSGADDEVAGDTLPEQATLPIGPLPTIAASTEPPNPADPAATGSADPSGTGATVAIPTEDVRPQPSLPPPVTAPPVTVAPVTVPPTLATTTATTAVLACPFQSHLRETVAGCGDTGPLVSEVQGLLRCIGYDVTESGTFDRRTYDAVIDAQRTLGLEVDGLAGPATIDGLTRWCGR